MSCTAREPHRAGDDEVQHVDARRALWPICLLLAGMAALAAVVAVDGMPLDCPPCPVPSLPVTFRAFDQSPDFRGVAVHDRILYGVTANHDVWSITFVSPDSARVRFQVRLTGSQGGARGLAIDRLGRFAVADNIRQAVGFYTPDGSLVASVPLPSRPSPIRPTGLAIDLDDTIYVVDAREDSVLVLPQGIGTWSSFPIPEGTDHTGLAFILDTGLLGTIDVATRELVIFDRNGVCVTSCRLQPGVMEAPIGFATGSVEDGAFEQGHTVSGFDNPPSGEGSFPIGEPVPAEPSTWGQLKALYR